MAQIAEYKKTRWFDHIIDVTDGSVVQEGTRFNQRRANNFEDGIETNRNLIIEQARKIQRMQVQLELDGRAPGNNGSFSDTLDGTTNKITREVATTKTKQAVSVGDTVLAVEDSTAFTALTQVTIFDATTREDVTITAVGDGTITVQALANGYSKGATITRSAANVDVAETRMTPATHTLYDVVLGGIA